MTAVRSTAPDAPGDRSAVDVDDGDDVRDGEGSGQPVRHVRKASARRSSPSPASVAVVRAQARRNGSRSIAEVWLAWARRASTFAPKVSVMSTYAVGARVGEDPDLEHGPGLEALGGQLGVGVGVAGVGVDRLEGGLAGGQVVGVAGEDPVPAPLRATGRGRPRAAPGG